MKQLLLSALLLAGLAACKSSQLYSWRSPLPQQKDNLILVQTGDSGLVALRKMVYLLQLQGHEIRTWDETALTFTSRLPLGEGSLPYVLVHVAVKGSATSQIELVGEYRDHRFGHRPVIGAAELTRAPYGYATRSFRLLERAAFAYLDGKVSYSRQKEADRPIFVLPGI